MKPSHFILTVIVLFFVEGCGYGSGSPNGSYTGDTTKASYDSSTTPLSSLAAVVNKNDPARKFVRTADIKFKVKSVVRSTYDIEDVVNRQGGFVTYTNLASSVDNVSNTAVSEDSMLETTSYNVTNTMTIRVPNDKLDTTLKEIAKNVDCLDHRIIKADDVALQMLSNELAQKRAAGNETRLANDIDTKGKKLAETTTAEETLSDKKEAADNAKIANLSLLDKVSLSTVNLDIYQRETTKMELISNNKSTTAYEPNFGTKILGSLKYGWDILEAIIVSIAKLWGLMLLALIAYFIYRKYGRRVKKGFVEAK